MDPRFFRKQIHPNPTTNPQSRKWTFRLVIFSQSVNNFYEMSLALGNKVVSQIFHVGRSDFRPAGRIFAWKLCWSRSNIMTTASNSAGPAKLVVPADIDPRSTACQAKPASLRFLRGRANLSATRDIYTRSWHLSHRVMIVLPAVTFELS